MASISSSSAACYLLILFMCSSTARTQLSSSFYSSSCPELEGIVLNAMQKEVKKDHRLPASILRLFFHDCFVNGCDASVLLADNATFKGEQNALPNRNSIRRLDFIETIKSAVEASCKNTVSCADILAIAARDAVVLSGGPSWTVPLGRGDARTASQAAANSNIPPPSSTLSALITSFSKQGLDEQDLVALSGAHTIGFAHCTTFRSRLYNDSNINAAFAALKKRTCPRSGGDRNLAALEEHTPRGFDNSYYVNLLSRRGLLHSDQEFFNNGSADVVVRRYAKDLNAFYKDFAAAMVKMGNIRPLSGSNGEIRRVCSRAN
ncbi:peroxidase P7-like [Wolffia australiana]